MKLAALCTLAALAFCPNVLSFSYGQFQGFNLTAIPENQPIGPRFSLHDLPTIPANTSDFTPQPRVIALHGCPRRMVPVYISPGDSVVWRLANKRYRRRMCGFRFRTSRRQTLTVKCSTFQLVNGQRFRIKETKTKKRHFWYSTSEPLQTFRSDQNDLSLRIARLSRKTRIRCRVQATRMRPKVPQCDCGEITTATRIVGGAPVEPHKAPYQVGLVAANKVTCGGAFLDEKWIVTAAHCTERLSQESPDFQVLIGGHSQSPFSEGTLVTPKRIVQHPNYNRISMDNDIALVEIDPVDLSQPELGTVCLPRQRQSFEDALVTVTGWGTTEYNGQQTTLLNEVSLTVLTRSLCNHVFRNQMTRNMLCAYAPGKDACQRDSGGPLVTMEGGANTLVGIVSWGYECARFPGVYTAVSRYVNWIMNNAEGFTLCE